MSRPPRAFRPGTAYHLIARFVANEFFLDEPQSRGLYLRFLGDGLKGTDWRCFSFAIMTNHIHIGAVAGTMALSSWLHDAHTYFADWINKKRHRIGSVFTRGPKDYEVLHGGHARLIGYHHMNPVRAGVVNRPEDSNWTSQRAYLGREDLPWLDVELGLRLAGFDTGEELARWTDIMHRAGRLSRTELALHQRRRKVIDVLEGDPADASDDSAGEEWLIEGTNVIVGRTKHSA